MLSRSADNLYWMTRYIERAEGIARLLDGTYAIVLLSHKPETEERELAAPLDIAADRTDFLSRYEQIATSTVFRYLILDPENPSSIRSCLEKARENARACRNVIPSDLWVGVNRTFLDMRDMTYPRLVEHGYQSFFDWVKERSHTVRGIVYGTVPRGETFRFARLGTFIERADNTARAVRVRMAAPSGGGERGDGGTDYYRWAAILRSLSALTAYSNLYRSEVVPKKVAEMLILRPEVPRSVRACTEEVLQILMAFDRRDSQALVLARQDYARLRNDRIDDVFRTGFDAYMLDLIDRVSALGRQIQRDFGMSG